jgi:hypothetical protein
MDREQVMTIEVGERAVKGLRLENFGLLRQRLDAIADRRYRDLGWRIHCDGSRGPMATSMTWHGVGGAPW